MQSPFGPAVDTSLLLRDILHHKDTFKSQHKGSASSGDSIKDIYSTDCNAEMISPLLHSKSSDMAYNARDNDNDLDNENDDMETATDNNSCGNDEDQSDDLDDRSLDASAQEDGLKMEHGTLSLGESKEAKRAHVENILTSMRQSPHADTMDSSVGVITGDVKRQKRKQPQPQQHESSLLHSEELALQKQIQQLQEQMQAVKRKREEDLSIRGGGDDDDDTEEEGGSKPPSPMNGGEFKRARVEHILSSMRSSTSPRTENGYELGNRVSPGSESGKRQKRKQTQPQQHDNSKSDHKDGGISHKHNNNNHGFSSKNFSANEDVLSHDDTLRDNNPGGLYGGNALFRSNLYRGLGDKDYIPAFHNGFDPNAYRDNLFRHSFFMRPELDPMAALRNVSKALHARTELALLPDVQPKAAPVDLSKIASALKTELVQAVNTAIDNAVSKVFNDKQAPNPDSSMTSESSSQTQQEIHQHHSNHQNHHSHHHQQQQQQQQQQHQQHQPLQQSKHHQSSGLLPHFMHQQQQHHQQMHHHRHQHQQQQQQQQLSSSHASDREAMKETVNISHGEKKSELIVPIAPFSDHLHFLERFGNRLQQEKLSAFEPLHKGESELITPHTGPSMPFHPHFPYYLPTQVLPPLYTGEPEQTEALPLIVNTQKKKRTKVTDTRLGSPRTKPALPQDTTTSSSMDHTDAQRQLAAAFQHFLPPILQTSVAIPNPSLSHASDIARRLIEAPFGDSRIPSPQDHSRNSPQSASDSPHFMSTMHDRCMSFSDDMMEASSQGGSLMISF
ncbi:unnamed protein product [Lymnaea stagnalis]|uniref:Uncharacterized protein n=1 Tax=Lymnaea stagnalis TaxID=6523 RepID=A0AAV2IH00_LYMST